MLSKFSGSRQDLQFVLLLGILLGVLGISLFLAVSMGSVAINLGDTYRIILSRLGISSGDRRGFQVYSCHCMEHEIPSSIVRSDSRSRSLYVW